MKTKYLGEYYIEYLINEEADEESTPYLINVDDEEDIYELGLFMRTQFMEDDYIIEGIGKIHATMCETNNSSIALQLDASCDGGKLWRIW